MMDLKEFKKFFDGQFFALLEEKGKTFSSYSDSKAVKEIIFHINMLAQEGKRFRPYMAYCGYITEGGEQDIFPLLAAIELLHFFCLVHDDVIDEAELRRGIATMNEKFGDNIAILAGSDDDAKDFADGYGTNLRYERKEADIDHVVYGY